MQAHRLQLTDEDFKRFEQKHGAPDTTRDRVEQKTSSTVGVMTAKPRIWTSGDPEAKFTPTQLKALKQLARACGYGDSLDTEQPLSTSSCRELATALEQVGKFLSIVRAGRGVIWEQAGIPGQRHMAS